ncbi:MAG TPA: carbohydrate ABC transporter permease [Gaiellaceae bacterium]|nr:carbohydrate ABC transporter permease [Gaiellaceae bacterium]
MTLQTTAAAEQVIPGRAPSEIARRALLYGLVVVVALVFLVPFVYTISTSFKTIPDSVNVTLIPHPWTTQAWRDMWTQYDFKLYFKNSFILCAVIVACNIFLAGLGGYAFARLKFPGRDLLFLVVLATIMVPDQLRLIPIYVMLTHWHLIGNFYGYILINLVTATNLFFMRQYFLTIPKDFEEAAKLDGAGQFKTFWRVMLPLALPAIGALTILQFQGTWNDFFWPLILFQGQPHLYTIQLGLANLRFTYTTLWPQIAAGSIIAIVPILVIFVALQRFFVSGAVTAGVKG